MSQDQVKIHALEAFEEIKLILSSKYGIEFLVEGDINYISNQAKIQSESILLNAVYTTFDYCKPKSKA